MAHKKLPGGPGSHELLEEEKHMSYTVGDFMKDIDKAEAHFGKRIVKRCLCGGKSKNLHPSGENEIGWGTVCIWYYHHHEDKECNEDFGKTRDGVNAFVFHSIEPRDLAKKLYFHLHECLYKWEEDRSASAFTKWCKKELKGWQYLPKN